MKYLAVEGLHAGYGAANILWGVNLEVPGRGDWIGVLGPNGAGKTTLMKALIGLIRPTQGSIRWRGLALEGLPVEARVSMGMAYVPAEKELFPSMRVVDVLMMGAYTKRARGRMEENLDLVLSIFPRLRERLHQRVSTLSGGEQQMLSIGRALMSSPELLLLDEPSMGLAPKLADQLFEALSGLREGAGLTVVLVEQRAGTALALVDYAYVLEGGRVVLEGPGGQLAGEDRVRSAYLGLV